MKKIIKISFGMVMLIVLSGCNSRKNKLLKEKMNVDEIDKIQVVLAMGNPKFGADSKIITDRNEIMEMVECFNNATVGEEVDDMDVDVSFTSNYYFYNGDNILIEIFFNGNKTDKLVLNSKFYYMEYSNDTPYELYKKSNAEAIKVYEE